METQRATAAATAAALVERKKRDLARDEYRLTKFMLEQIKDYSKLFHDDYIRRQKHLHVVITRSTSRSY